MRRGHIDQKPIVVKPIRFEKVAPFNETPVNQLSININFDNQDIDKMVTVGKKKLIFLKEDSTKPIRRKSDIDFKKIDMKEPTPRLTKRESNPNLTNTTTTPSKKNNV